MDRVGRRSRKWGITVLEICAEEFRGKYFDVRFARFLFFQKLHSRNWKKEIDFIRHICTSGIYCLRYNRLPLRRHTCNFSRSRVREEKKTRTRRNALIVPDDVSRDSVLTPTVTTLITDSACDVGHAETSACFDAAYYAIRQTEFCVSAATAVFNSR